MNLCQSGNAEIYNRVRLQEGRTGLTQIRLRRGLDIRVSGIPTSSTVARQAVSSVGLSGLDYPEVRAEFLVEQGQSVVAGQALLRDRRRPKIVVTSPTNGTVTALVRRDPETAAFFIGLAATDTDPVPYDVPREWRRGDVVRSVLLESGLWTCLLERPFGRIPDPDGMPDAIFVTAMPADRLAPDTAVAMAGHESDFSVGIEALGQLADCPVHVCQGPGPELAANTVTFTGAYPAGLPGIHVHHLCPVENGRRAWTLNYQDVMAIGHLFNVGRLETNRTIALAGPGARTPCLLRAPLGANIEDIVRGRIYDGDLRLVSGPLLSGRETQYLGRAHLQVCVLPIGWRTGKWAILPRVRRVGPIIPVAAHEKAFPFDLPAVPLLRAIAVGDSETSRDLGCLELLEEDIAVLSYVCPSNNDYAPMLRAVLNELRHDL